MEELTNDVLLDIAEALSFVKDKPFSSCSFQSDSGLVISVKEFGDGKISAHPATYEVTISDSDDGENLEEIFFVTLHGKSLDFIYNLYDEYQGIDVKRRALEAEIQKLDERERETAHYLALNVKDACSRGKV